MKANCNRPTLARIIGAACRYHGVMLDEVLATDRHQDIVECRATIVGAARHWTFASFPDIARAMGRTSHTSAFNQHRRWLRLPESVRCERLRILLELTP